MNITRLLVIIIVINTLVGLSIGSYIAIDEYNSQQITIDTNYLTSQENIVTDSDNIFSGVRQTDASQYESTAGNTMTTSWMIWNVFIKGINPWSIYPAQYNTVFEQETVRILIFFRTILSILSLVALFMLIKNKSTT